MRSTRTAVLTAVTAAALTVTGCSASVTGAPAPVGAASNGGSTPAPAATNDPVDWMNRVCGSLLPFQASFASAPKLGNSDAVANAKSLSDFLGRTETTIDKAVTDLDAAGPSPVAGGDAAVTKIKTALTTVRTSFDKAKKALDAVDPSDAAQVASTLPTVLTSLASISTIQDPTTDIKNNPTLRAAYAQAPNCQTLAKDS
jgi:hypothetical protein